MANTERIRRKRRKEAGVSGPVWLSSASVVLIVALLLGMLVIVIFNSIPAFWPAPLMECELSDGTMIIGEMQKRDSVRGKIQIRIGNRDIYPADFIWVDENLISKRSYPADICRVERVEHGPFFGRIGTLSGPECFGSLEQALTETKKRVRTLTEKEGALAEISAKIEKLKRKYLHEKKNSAYCNDSLEARILELKKTFEVALAGIESFRKEIRMTRIQLKDSGEQIIDTALADVLSVTYSNKLGTGRKLALVFSKIGSLITENPREANMEGGLFPALFGTTFMVILMSFLAVPFGVVTAVYLNYYAEDGLWVRLVRIATNNLAGVPSIVFGIFGLSFFVYTVGGAMDKIFFFDSLPSPTMGTGGILWASVTMALLTVPVVIVATEEGLNAVPHSIREASLALGATRWQSLIRVVLPMSMPSILTGTILAIARAAGEVAPLMLVGVVKSAPDLVVSGHFPFVHLERKFMHLGFHIYDIGFQSPNVEAALPMVFATTLLLLTLVLSLSIIAMILRTKMRKRLEGQAL